MAATTFYGLSLATAPGRVMTPRPATEQLVRAALAQLPGRGGRVADVGTGSGAIAVAIAVASPLTEVWATDTNHEAVALATVNAARHGVSERVHACHGDLLSSVPGELDLVVANLPYLPLRDRGRYPGLGHEPASAVFAEEDGLGPYRRLLRQSSSRLTCRGAVILQLDRRPVVVPRAELALWNPAPSGLAEAA